jgi:hypothetical protein
MLPGVNQIRRAISHRDVIAATAILRLVARRGGQDLVQEDTMTTSRSARAATNLGIASALMIFLGACGGGGFSLSPSSPSVPETAVEPEMPATIRPDELVGKWGLASYQNPNDRARTEKQALAQCKQPYTIGAGTAGGVVMHLADQATPQELRLKGSSGGKNYIGPSGPPGGEQDREVISFDGRVLVTRFVDKDAGTRYGNMVYVRCGPRA